VSIKTNKDRLWNNLMEMAKIGATEKGGSCRLALTTEDKAGRDLFVKWCKAAGCSLSVDNMGNMFFRRAGSDPNAPPIAMGSHLDTQPHGGKFDGVYGVLAGLEVVCTLNDNHIGTCAPIEIIVWTNEEGSRFAPAMLASSVFAGVFDLEYGLSRKDKAGITVESALQSIGYAGDMVCGDHMLGAFFEAHIEQGPLLEEEGKTIGVVKGAQGARWYDVIVKGTDAHAGSTPMNGRRDALVVAARIIDGLHNMALLHGPDAVATVGELAVSPNSRNTIPGEVLFSVDIRHHSEKTLKELDRVFQTQCHTTADAMGLEVEITDVWYQPPVLFNEICVNAVEHAASELTLPYRKIFSGAGHDACLVSRVSPTGMIFVPCEGGISHNESENANADDLAAGCDVLINAVLSQAGIVNESLAV